LNLTAGNVLRTVLDRLATIETVQTGIRGADPDPTQMVTENRSDGALRKTVLSSIRDKVAILIKEERTAYHEPQASAAVLMDFKEAAGGDAYRRILDFEKLPAFENPQTFVGYDPDRSIMRSIDGFDVIVRHLLTFAIYREAAVSKAVESLRRADPQIAAHILRQCPHGVIRKTIRRGVSSDFAVAQPQQPILRTGPDIPLAIRKHTGVKAGLDLRGIRMIEARKPYSVKPYEGLIGRKPEVAFPTLGDFSPGWRSVGYRPGFEHVLRRDLI
jgi:hypothetical protein